MTDFSSPEFDQAATRAAMALANKEGYEWERCSASLCDLYRRKAGAALLAVLQPEACLECGGGGSIDYDGPDPVGAFYIDCPTCGGSGFSTTPPPIIMAVMELLAEGYWPNQDMPSYRYVPLSTTTTNEATSDGSRT